MAEPSSGRANNKGYRHRSSIPISVIELYACVRTYTTGVRQKHAETQDREDVWREQAKAREGEGERRGSLREKERRKETKREVCKSLKRVNKNLLFFFLLFYYFYFSYSLSLVLLGALTCQDEGGEGGKRG